MFFALILFLFLLISSIHADDYPDTIGSATLISLNTAVQGTITCGGDLDFFKVNLVAGRSYTITMQALNPASPGFDDYLRFYDSSQTEIDHDDDSVGKNAVITQTISSTGVYYVRASGFDGGECGTYVLAVMDTSSCSGSCTSCTTVTTPSPCTICGSGKACSGCSNAASSNIVGGACPCAPGQNLGDGCLACSSMNAYCIQCSSISACTDCSGSYLNYGATCVSSCPSEAYTSGTSCIACTTLNGFCATCNSSTTCLSCSGGYVALGPACTGSCLPGTYNNNGLCTACQTLDNDCTTCNSSTTCTGCSNSKYALGATCSSTCPINTYINSGICTSCLTLNDYCTTCNSSNACTGCSNSKYALGATCVDTCPGDTYINSGVCTSCKTLDDYCLTCNGTVTCTSCSNSKYALGQNCVDTCPGDTYINTGICTSCKTLDDYCTSCNGSITCTGCSNSKYALGQNCVDSCPIGTYNLGGICTSCFTLNDECTTCNSTLTCTGCLNSKYALGATCVDTCPGDTYINNGICTSCKTLDDYCISCNGTVTCTGCSNSKLALGPSCVDSCPLGTYDNNGVCTSCYTLDDSCQYCNSSLHCTSCIGGLDALGSSCVTECPTTAYDLGGICTSCATLDDSCILCNSSISCLGCSGGLVALGSGCTYPCPIGTYDNSGLCTSCRTLDDYCAECSISTFCSVCDASKLIYGPNCVDSCPSGSKNTEGICSSTSYKVYLSYTSSVTSYLVQFPSALVYDVNVTLNSIVTLENIDSSAYNYTMAKVSTTVYQIDFQTTVSIPSTTMKIRYTLTGTPATDNTITGRWIASLTTRYMGYLSDSDKKLTEDISSAVSAAITGATAGAGSIALFGGNPALLWPLLNLFQAFYYLIFIDVNYPANVQIFLKIFSLGSLGFIPNPLDWFVENIDEYTLPVPGRYNEYDFSGLFLDNAGNELLLLALVLAAYLVSKIAMKWLRKLPTSARFLTNKTVGWFEWSGILKSLIASYTDMVQAIFLQLRVLTYYSRVFILSSVLSFITLGFAVVLPVIVFIIIRKYDKKPELLCIKYDALVEEYDLKKKAGRYFVPIWLLRRFIMCLSLVFLQGYPYVQINILCILMIISIFHLWVYAPYPSKKVNVCNTIMEILFGSIHAVIYVLIYDDHNPSFTEAQRLQLGWVIIVACGVILIISVGLNFFEQAKEVIKAIRMVRTLLLSKPAKKKPVKKRERKQSHVLLAPERARLSDQTSSLEANRNTLDISCTDLRQLTSSSSDYVVNLNLSPRRAVKVKRIKRERLARRIQELREINM